MWAVSGWLGLILQLPTFISVAMASISHTLRSNELTHLFRSVVPKLEYHLHKGQMGRIGIVGGSLDYTGAPYYAAQSSLYFGADLATIFCSADALIPIKTYSPELMVTPLYDATEIELLEDNQIATQLVTKLKPYLLRLHALVVGPGLGRHPKLLPNLAPSIRLATETHLPYVGTSDSEISPSIDWCLMPMVFSSSLKI
jgi:ATP-dependent NAD(P)H-hydrate dehydratase